MKGINMENTNRKFGIRTGIGTTTGKKTASETSTGTMKGLQRQGKERHGSYRDRDSESCITGTVKERQMLL
jgi:hypothetical protein